MPTVQFKSVRAWTCACILLSAVSTYAGDAAKPVTHTASKGVTVPVTAAKPKSAAVKAPSQAGTSVVRMQVVEPGKSAPPSVARPSKAWQKIQAKGLTDEQKQAFRERKEGMETLIAVIKDKRKALHAAKPEDRAVLARELHSLILERDEGAGTASARVEGVEADETKAADPSDAAAKVDGRALRQEEYRRQLEQIRRQENSRKLKQDNQLEKVNKTEMVKQRKARQAAGD